MWNSTFFVCFFGWEGVFYYLSMVAMTRGRSCEAPSTCKCKNYYIVRLPLWIEYTWIWLKGLILSIYFLFFYIFSYFLSIRYQLFQHLIFLTYSNVSSNLGIKYMYAEPNGTKIAFIDTKNQGYIYSPVTDALILVREIPAR